MLWESKPDYKTEKACFDTLKDFKFKKADGGDWYRTLWFDSQTKECKASKAACVEMTEKSPQLYPSSVLWVAVDTKKKIGSRYLSLAKKS